MKHFIPAIKIFFYLTVLTGIIYPLAITLIAQSFFSEQANGSLIFKNGKVIGSSLIAQGFKDPKYFWPRPSAVDYNPIPSGGSNLGPISIDLKSKVEERKKAGLTRELLFASGSGLDPHISPDAALDQVDRVISARRIPLDSKKSIVGLINKLNENRDFGIFGEQRVNVLKLNLLLDEELKNQ